MAIRIALIEAPLQNLRKVKDKNDWIGDYLMVFIWCDFKIYTYVCIYKTKSGFEPFVLAHKHIYCHIDHLLGAHGSLKQTKHKTLSGKDFTRQTIKPRAMMKVTQADSAIYINHSWLLREQGKNVANQRHRMLA